MALTAFDTGRHPWKLVDPSDGMVIATAAERAFAMAHACDLLAPDGPYFGITLDCAGFAPRTYRDGDLDRHVRAEYASDCHQAILRMMQDRAQQVADDAAQLASEIAGACAALHTLCNDMIDDPDDLAALNEVGARVVQRYARHDLLSGWYAALDLVREPAADDDL